MTFETLWNQLVQRNPSLANPDGEVTMKVSGIKKQLQQAYDKGFSEGVDDGFRRGFKQSQYKPNDPMEAFFQGMFKGARK